MKAVGIWLSAASALALAACGQARKPASPASPPVAAASPAPATGAAGQASMATATAAAGSTAGGEADGARSAAASGRSGGRAFAAQTRAEGRQTPRRERSVEAGDGDPDAQTPDLAWETLDGLQHRYSAAYRTCMGSAHGFTAAIADCYSAELARQGERLNRAYETAVAARSGERKRRLVTAQRDWARQRDSICEADDGPDLLHEGSCRLNLTIKRADELESRAG